jgi:hypothetical protein
VALVLTAVGVVFCIALMITGHFWSVLIGGVIGSFFGIAGFGGAISGAIPGAIVGALISMAMRASKRDNQ